MEAGARRPPAGCGSGRLRAGGSAGDAAARDGHARKCGGVAGLGQVQGSFVLMQQCRQVGHVRWPGGRLRLGQAATKEGGGRNSMLPGVTRAGAHWEWRGAARLLS